MGGSIGLTAAIGGIILAVVILYALLRNQRRTATDRQRTEEATRDLYARTDRQDQATDPDHKRF
jgi:hypothetical protein